MITRCQSQAILHQLMVVMRHRKPGLGLARTGSGSSCKKRASRRPLLTQSQRLRGLLLALARVQVGSLDSSKFWQPGMQVACK